MLQSTSRSSESQSTAVAEPSGTLPPVAAERKVTYKLSSEVWGKENCQQLPPIVDNPGKNMMSLLIGRRMERSNSPSDLRVVVYESLEQKRANKIGVKPLRNFDVTRSRRMDTFSDRHSLPPILTTSSTPAAPQLQPFLSNSLETGFKRGNTLAPFTTLAPKPTCGFYFNRETLNKKVRIGVPPSDLVKWRTDYSLFPQPQKQA